MTTKENVYWGIGEGGGDGEGTHIITVISLFTIYDLKIWTYEIYNLSLTIYFQPLLTNFPVNNSDFSELPLQNYWHFWKVSIYDLAPKVKIYWKKLLFASLLKFVNEKSLYLI